MRKLACLILIILLIPACKNGSDERIKDTDKNSGPELELSLNLVKGETCRHKTIAESTVTQNLYGQVMTITLEIEGSMSFIVESVNDDYYEMEVV
ncbi:MAG: hypothetical protein JW801_02580 [Bacteroidales bacterium]|nr:hypothetical protein [Bacteroidales bacterium]